MYIEGDILNYCMIKKLFHLFFTFFKIGLFTFGGGYAMVSQMKDVIVDKKKWLTEEELMHIITISESTPGPIAINSSTYIGYKRGGVLGSVFATLGTILPSLMIITLISLVFKDFMEIEYVKYAFKGINCAVAFLIIKTAIEMFIKLKKNIITIITFIISLILLIVFEILSISVSSIYFILVGGVIGIIIYSIKLTRENKEITKWFTCYYF